ncbi:GDSL-type esterase/lipase family protein [Pseudoalteromonas sp. TB64]|uniref:GDSL-type esterase/lipase family protein n=1 Tax=Pseudoalteromonas sp. TB64 TaxID=1938600 RepID=UPI000416D4C4|nr:GDSL-type esterase/lipase family protein [Pseudoalteromonas sp. TB64]
MIKNILCFGDSNTWGLNPQTGKRFDESIRWSALLATKLGSAFKVIEAGQLNRTLVNHPPFNGLVSGVSYLKPYLEKYPLDVIIIALGTNDLKKHFNLAPVQIAQGLDDLIGDIKYFYGVSNHPKIIVLAPAYVECVGSYKHVYEGSEHKNHSMSEHFKRIALNKAALFFDLQSVVSVSLIDGVHICSKGHSKVADVVFKIMSKDIVLA